MNWLIKIIFFALTSMLLVLVLLFSLLGLMLGLLRWLVTGQKPQIAVIFSGYRQWKQQAARHMGRAPHHEDIIDAEVREVPPVQIEDRR